jgi:energy-coupling factor transporter ATP-binding protein EcfA2
MERKMIVCLVGKAGVGKTTIANAMEELVPDSFVIDGDDLRAETSNIDIGLGGREKNMHLGYSRARWLSDLGFTVFIAMQAPIKEIREEYLKEEDVQIIIKNSGPNPKDDKGYNKNFEADYSGIDLEYEFMEFTPEDFYDKVFKKVLVIARFQGMHRGHRLVMEAAKRLSPDITIALRVDEGDILDLDSNIKLLKDLGYHVIKSPDIDEDNKIWEDFVSDYDVVVQGNPVVISKFQKAVDDNKVNLFFIPRIGHISATKIREAIKEGNEEFARKYVADEKVLDFLKEEIS